MIETALSSEIDIDSRALFTCCLRVSLLSMTTPNNLALVEQSVHTDNSGPTTALIKRS